MVLELLFDSHLEDPSHSNRWLSRFKQPNSLYRSDVHNLHHRSKCGPSHQDPFINVLQGYPSHLLVCHRFVFNINQSHLLWLHNSTTFTLFLYLLLNTMVKKDSKKTFTRSATSDAEYKMVITDLDNHCLRSSATVKMILDSLKNISGWRCPSGGRYPSPNTGKIVIFIDYFHWSFKVSLHQFLKGLLLYYESQLPYFTPNDLLFMSIFISYCKNFLGIEPHWSLFHKYFIVNYLKVKSDPDWLSVGCIKIKRHEKAGFFQLKPSTSIPNWVEVVLCQSLFCSTLHPSPY